MVLKVRSNKLQGNLVIGYNEDGCGMVLTVHEWSHNLVLGQTMPTAAAGYLAQ
jgi:hypothetical protein